jgi:hypothetical protein
MTETKLLLLDRLGWTAVVGMSLVPLLPYAFIG